MTLAYAFKPADLPSLAIADSPLRLPVRRIWCVGRNYAAHAREMGADPDRDPPFFFSKPADAVVSVAEGEDKRVAYPPQTANLHHEVELVIALGSGGSNLDPDAAEKAIFGYAVGIDLTRRDLQNAAKAKGHPWEMGKAFDQSAPIGAICRPGRVPSAGRIWLEVAGALRQEGDLADMIWSIPETIAHLSRFVGLAAGDLIFTGTPEGVGPIVRGERVRAGIDTIGQIEIELV